MNSVDHVEVDGHAGDRVRVFNTPWVLVLFAASIVACGGGAPSRVASTTPTESAFPSSSRDASSLVTLLKAKRVAIGEVEVYTADNDPNKLLGRPHQYASKVNWHDTRLDPANFDVAGGGSIEAFSNSADLSSRVRYVSGISQSAAIFAEYEYSSETGLFFLRLSHNLTPNQAMDYVSALQGIYPDLKKD